MRRNDGRSWAAPCEPWPSQAQLAHTRHSLRGCEPRLARIVIVEGREIIECARHRGQECVESGVSSRQYGQTTFQLLVALNSLNPRNFGLAY